MANEKRLAAYDPVAFGEFTQSLIKSLEVYDPYSDGYEDGVGRLEDWLEFNAVDAAEVVHGRWEDEHGGKYANPRYRCSVCKAKALYKMEQDLWLSWHEVQALTPTCPYCSARMDGGNEDG